MWGLDPATRGYARVFGEATTRRCMPAWPLRNSIVPAIFCSEALRRANKCTVVAIVLDETPLGKRPAGWQRGRLEVGKVDPRRSPAIHPIAKYAQEEHSDDGKANTAWCCRETELLHIFMNITKYW